MDPGKRVALASPSFLGKPLFTAASVNECPPPVHILSQRTYILCIHTYSYANSCAFFVMDDIAELIDRLSNDEVERLYPTPIPGFQL
jgi:hypothetical protein